MQFNKIMLKLKNLLVRKKKHFNFWKKGFNSVGKCSSRKMSVVQIKELVFFLIQLAKLESSTLSFKVFTLYKKNWNNDYTIVVNGPFSFRYEWAERMWRQLKRWKTIQFLGHLKPYSLKFQLKVYYPTPKITDKI